MPSPERASSERIEFSPFNEINNIIVNFNDDYAWAPLI